MATPFLGQITVYPYSFPPNGWADCNGQLLLISQYSALFSLLGIQYGGNGTTNFALPDLQGRIPVGQGQLPGGSDYSMGTTGGEENVTLGTSSIPQHNHALNASTTTGSTNNPAGMILAKPQVSGGHGGGADKGNIYNPAVPDTSLAAASIGFTGGSLPHNNIQPSLVLRYCIALQGIFPSRQ
jgi:microcystin-dependent protein